MAICNSVQNIAASECIGDSLVKINNNFSNLNTDACTLLTLLNQLSASVPPAGSVIQTSYSELIGPQIYSTDQTLGVATPPTITSGREILRIDNFATSGLTNYVIIQANSLLTSGSQTSVILMLFANNTLLATANGPGTNEAGPLIFTFKYTPPTTAGINYTIRAASESGNLNVNRLYTVTDYNTGKQVSSMLIQEIKG